MLFYHTYKSNAPDQVYLSTPCVMWIQRFVWFAHKICVCVHEEGGMRIVRPDYVVVRVSGSAATLSSAASLARIVSADPRVEQLVATSLEEALTRGFLV